MLSLLIFLLVLSVLVLIHELGHFIAARICGVKVDEFGYGFPPRAIGFLRQQKTWKRVKNSDTTSHPGTIWSINWLPLGGFVRLKGEEGNHANESDAFAGKSIWRRLFILAAGVSMNWLLAAAIFMAAFAIGVPMQTDGLPKEAIIRQQEVQIVDVLKDSAAAKAGIQPGDFLLKIDEQSVPDVQDAQNRLAANQTINLVIEHQGEQKRLTVKPEYVSDLRRAGLGVALANTGFVRFPWYLAIGHGFVTAWTYTKLIVLGLAGFVRDLIAVHRVPSDLAGPVGIAVLTGRVAQQGFWSVMQFAAILSLNLAVVNFLPIPALDGGRALFLAVESLRRRRLNPRVESLIHQIGFIALLLLIFIVTIHDLRQYGGVIWNGLKQISGI
ncbi:MAG TPA: M50 family metallopeptidase [Patescibacteria group bacterium]|nr:M50 family metallopeptidase [Patescibacteria group bacterium]